MELAYLQTIRLGHATLEQTTADTSSYLAQLYHTWKDVYFYELPFLYADVLFLLCYSFILTCAVLKKSLTLSVPIMAANWIVGMMLGMSVAVVSQVGLKVLEPPRVGQVVVIMVTWIVLCFAAYAAAMEMQMMHGLSSCPTSSSCEEKTSQEPRSDCDTPANTKSLMEAHIV